MLIEWEGNVKKPIPKAHPKVSKVVSELNSPSRPRAAGASAVAQGKE